MDVNNEIMDIHNCRELYIHNWIMDVRSYIGDTRYWIMGIHSYTQLQIHMAIHN